MFCGGPSVTTNITSSQPDTDLNKSIKQTPNMHLRLNSPLDAMIFLISNLNFVDKYVWIVAQNIRS